MSLVVKVDAFGGEALERADKVLSGVPDGVKKAINSAMPRAVAELRKKSSERIRERYAISEKNIRSEETIKVSYQTGNGVIASVRFSGRKIPLYRFDGSRPKSPIYDKNDRPMGMCSSAHLLHCLSMHSRQPCPMTIPEYSQETEQASRKSWARLSLRWSVTRRLLRSW